MSTRLGMADSRCQDWTSNRLINDKILKTANIQESDNYTYRKFLQTKDPSEIYPVVQCSLSRYSESDKDFDIFKNTNVMSRDSDNN